MAEERQKKLVLSKRKSNIEKWILISTAKDILLSKADVNTEYQVVAHCVNEIKMGWYKAGGFVFADGDSVSDEYLQQLRVFNENEEILIKKTGHTYWVRKIDDSCGTEVKTVDSTSIVFGKRVEAVNLPEDFVKVFEPGRKVNLVLPVKENSDKYCVTTRSYVTYDKKTGQAGYGYYRYVAIEVEGGK